MPVHDDLGTRLKVYESVSRNFLMRRTPVAIRIDGRAFHTFLRGFKRPFDQLFIDCMDKTTQKLCENIQGCKIGYVQSDEITLILTDYDTLKTDAWFENNVQKITSVSASMATCYFNKVFSELVNTEIRSWHSSMVPQSVEYQQKMEKYHKSLRLAEDLGATFDSRAFNIPKEEVTNLIYWRQLDAIRNSIQACGQAQFSHSELEHKTCAMIKEMLEERGCPWEKIPIYQQRGRACIRNEEGKWFIDYHIPIFKDEGREYIETLI